MRHMCSKIVKRRVRGGGVGFESNARETPVYAMTQENINYLLSDGYNIYDNKLPSKEANYPLSVTLKLW